MSSTTSSGNHDPKIAHVAHPSHQENIPEGPQMLDSSNASEEEVKEGGVKPHPTIILRERRNAAVSKKSGKLSFKPSDQKR